MGQSADDHLVHMQTAQLLVLEFAIYLWKQTPGIGLAAEPVVSSAASHQFYLACCLPRRQIEVHIDKQSTL